MYKHTKKINKMIGGKSQEEKIKSMFETLTDLEKTIETRKTSKSQTKEQKKKLKSVKDAFDTQLDNLKKSLKKYYRSGEGKGSANKTSIDELLQTTSIGNLLQTNTEFKNFLNSHIKTNTSISNRVTAQINSNTTLVNSNQNSLTLSPETSIGTNDNNNISTMVITPLSESNSNNPMVPIYQTKKLPPYSRVKEISQQTQKQDILNAKFNTMLRTYSILSSKLKKNSNKSKKSKKFTLGKRKSFSKTKHSKRNNITECKKENRLLKSNLQELKIKNELLTNQLKNFTRSQHQNVLNTSRLIKEPRTESLVPRRSPLKSGNENIVLNNHSISSPVVPTPTPPPAQSAPVLPISPVPSSSASVLSSNKQKSKSICELLKNN